MKRSFVVTLFIILVLTVSAVCLAEDSRTISVTGEAEVRVVPNEVVLSFGAEDRDLVLDNAIKANDDRVRKIMAVLAKFNIEAKFVQTSMMGVRPLYENGYNKNEFKGYEVSKSITLTVRNTNQFEAILKSVLEAGANSVGGIRFGTTEIRKYRDQARAMAIRAAREKAEQLASELGQRIGKPRNIKEESSYPYTTSANNGLSNSFGWNGSGETFALGQISINARITVEFELMD
ncbi:MAG TPA: SIMPL domain-containing protein [Bacillota bacterium]|nr:SIMPL domain-containing protein [Bacillota bacterium]